MKHAFVAAACLTALAGSANAQMRAPNADLNKDGKVTLAEFKKVQGDTTLSRMDGNKDGKITREEFKAVEARAKTFGGAEMAQRISAMFPVMDANKDGVVVRDEIEAAAARRFGRGDANADGWLSPTELADMRQTRTRAD